MASSHSLDRFISFFGDSRLVGTLRIQGTLCTRFGPMYDEVDYGTIEKADGTFVRVYNATGMAIDALDSGHVRARVDIHDSVVHDNPDTSMRHPYFALKSVAQAK